MFQLSIFSSGLEETENLDITILDTSKIENHPSLRYGHSMILRQNLLYIFGGYDGEYCSNAMFIFDITRETWNRQYYTDRNVEERYFHAACEGKDHIYIHGGRKSENGQVLGDLISFNPVDNSFTRITSTNKSPCLYGHSLAFSGKQVFFIGGRNEKNEFSRTICAFNTQTLDYLQISIESSGSSKLPPLCFQRCVYETNADILTCTLFCGIDKKGCPQGEKLIKLQFDPDIDDMVIFDELEIEDVAEQVIITSCFEMETQNEGKKLFGFGTVKNENIMEKNPCIYLLKEKTNLGSSSFYWKFHRAENLEKFDRVYHTDSYVNNKLFIFGGFSRNTKSRQSLLLKKEKNRVSEVLETNINFEVLADKLPPDCVYCVIRFLEIKDILSLILCSKSWGVSIAARSNLVWMEIFRSALDSVTLKNEKIIEEIENCSSYYNKYIVLRKYYSLFHFSSSRYHGPKDIIDFGKLKKEFEYFVKKKKSNGINITCCLIGDKGVGKKWLLQKMKDKEHFNPDCLSTVGEIEGYKIILSDLDIRVNFNTVVEYEDYDRFRGLLYQNFSVFVLCFDISNRKSFENIAKFWINDVLKNFLPKNFITNKSRKDVKESIPPPFLLVGMKRDMEQKGKRQVSVQEAVDLAKECSQILYYVETSTLQNYHITQSNIFGKLIFATYMTNVYIAKAKIKSDECKVM